MSRKEEYQDERWRERASEIRALDHNQCVMCGAKDVELHVHHLSYPPPPFHIWDAHDTELVTLCKDCHAKIHQCKKRPKFNESRELFDIETEEKKGDCWQCKYYIQPFLLEDTEKFCFEYDGYCEKLGGNGCCFKAAVVCTKCAFNTKCFRKTVDNTACGEYTDRRCQFCKHYSEYTDSDGYGHEVCKRTGDEISWASECEDFESAFSNHTELKEYLKRFD